MLLGIMSDSHNDHRMVNKAVSLFQSQGVEYIIHCGDVGGANVFEELTGYDFSFVWGNTDHPQTSTIHYLDSVGIKSPNQIPATLELADKKIAVFHGHESAFRDSDQLDVDYIFHGHTHVRRDEKINGKRIINPGALHRAEIKTVATLHLATDQLTYHEIK